MLWRVSGFSLVSWHLLLYSFPLILDGFCLVFPQDLLACAPIPVPPAPVLALRVPPAPFPLPSDPSHPCPLCLQPHFLPSPSLDSTHYYTFWHRITSAARRSLSVGLSVPRVEWGDRTPLKGQGTNSAKTWGVARQDPARTYTLIRLTCDL